MEIGTRLVLPSYCGISIEKLITYRSRDSEWHNNRALFSLWMACCFCKEKESLNHLFFKCREMKTVWKNILEWLQINHIPDIWSEELKWITDKSKSKGSKGSILNVPWLKPYMNYGSLGIILVLKMSQIRFW